MPCLDMPLDQLKTYTGTNPCPADIDKYWDDALDELNAIDPNAEFVKSDFPGKGVECFDLYFTSTKNARIHAKFVKPEKIEGKIPAILMFHGLSSSCYNWLSLYPYAYQNYVVVSMDCRGQGGISEDSGSYNISTFSTPFVRGLAGDKHNMYQRDLFLDTAMIARVVMDLPYVDETRVGATGHSQGGGLSVACAALVPQIKKCAPVYPYLSDYKRVWEMDLDEDAYYGIKYFFRTQDPLHEKEDEIWEKLGYIDIQNLAKRVKAELLMTTGLRDKICPPSTQFAMYNKLTCKKQIMIYPEFGHETIPTSDEKIFEFLSDL